MKKTIRERIDSYIKDKYDIDPEILCVKPKDRSFADYMMQQKGKPLASAGFAK